jgi:hypothetical protein
MVLALAGLGVALLDLWLNPPRGAVILQSGDETTSPTNATATVPKAGNKRQRLLKWARTYWPVAFLWLLVGAATWAGIILGAGNPSLSGHPSTVVALAAGAVFLAVRGYSAFQTFALTFADTVYRNFLALPKRV